MDVSNKESVEQSIMTVMISHGPREDGEGEKEIRKGIRVHCFCLQGHL